MKNRKPKTPRVQPEAVVKAALEILDAEGLEGVTLRRLAAKLGVKASTLYWYFKDKQDIVDDMAQAILTTDKLNNVAAPANIADWAYWLSDLAHSVRNALIAHREGGRVVAGASLFRAHTLAKIAILATQVLNQAGFDDFHANLAIATVFNYVWGSVIEEQAGTGTEHQHEPLLPNIQKAVLDKFGLKDTQFIDHITAERSKHTETEDFDWGLQVIINGLKSTIGKAPES